MHFGFVQPIFVWALAGLAIPVIVHLVFKRRSRQIDLGTLRFLKSVIEANARSRNLKRWLLLAMRLGCVALLIAVFARPHVRGFEAESSRGFMAILIDQSASMDRRGPSGRLIEQAIVEARKVLEQTRDVDEIRVAYFDHAIHPVEMDSDRMHRGDSAVEQLQVPKALSGATNFSAAMAWARDVCVKSSQQKRRVILYTDLQRSGLDWTETQSLPADVDVQIVDLGQPQTSNASVSSIKTAVPVLRPGKPAQISATIYNAGPFVLDKVDVVLHASQGLHPINLRQQVNLAAGSTGLVEFETPELVAGLWQGYVRLEHDDDLKFDNQRWFAALVAPPLSTLIVDGQPDELPERAASYYLQTALRLAPPGEVAAERLFEPTVLPLRADSKWPDLQQSSLIVLANIPSVAMPDAERLSKWVQAGGGLLVFVGEPTTAEGMQTLIRTGLGVGTLRGFATSNEAPWRLEKWDANHPVFDVFGDIQRGELPRRAFRGIARIEPDPNVAVLAQFTGGSPAVLEKNVGRGKVIWFAAGCDGQWSDWPRSRLYLPLNYQLLSYLGGLAEGGPVRNVTIDDPLGNESTPGIYERENHWVAVNISPRESETDRCTVTEFADRFGIKLNNSSTDVLSASTDMLSASSVSAGFDVRDDELWPAVLIFLLFLMLAETMLANRTTS